MRKMLLLKRAKDLFLLSVLINFNLSAQISEGGSPLFLSKAKSTPSIPVARLPKINNDSLLLRDMQQENYLKGFNFAAAIHTEYDTQNSGIWIESNNGGQIWLLRVESENAGSLNFVLNYQLEPGAKLFIYNPETGKTLGAYTSANNKPWGRLAVQPIRGNKAIFEYHVPKGVSQGILGIKTVGHGYLKAYNPYFDREYNDFGRSKECQPDINGPQGQGWQNEKRSVVKIVAQLDQHTFSSFSGVLVNNTAQDQTPYILTCEHGINGWSNDPDYTPATGAQNSIYFFNYESPEPGVDGGQSQSISGAILRATKPDLDFALLELSVSVPENYTPYFAGWDRRKLELEFAVGISHPMGDVKKIAKTKSPVIPDETFNPDYPYRLNTHYEIVGWDYGSLEGGSSGSPMFSPEAHRVTSILSGGSSKDCGEQHIERNTYQMLYYCWADTEVESQQLKHWLDPVDLGVEFIDGFGPYDTDKVYFWPDRDLCYLNEPIIFSDHSIGEYNNYRWNFGESAVPQTATGKNPVTVSYTEVGVYTASLTVTNKDGQDETFSLENYIEVFYRAPVAGFEVSNRVVSLGDNTTFTNLSTGIIMSYEWDFDEGAEPRTLETTSTDPVTVAYTTPGFKRIKLTAINPSGSDTKQYTLLVNEDITASFTIEPGPYFTGDTVHMESAEDKWAEDGYNCFWSINGEKASQDKELTFSNSFNTSGKHTISFNVSSPLEIKDEKAIEIEVVDHIQTTPSISVDNATIICNVENGKNDESYFWDFGDGNTSTEEAPSHEYTEAGIYAVTLTVSNPYEEISITKDCVIDIVLGINDGEINNGAELKIYPNPATEYFTVKFPKSREVTNIQLFSATGTLVYFKQTQDSDLKVNCNDLAPGFYLVVVQVGKNQKITRKIIVS